MRLSMKFSLLVVITLFKIALHTVDSGSCVLYWQFVRSSDCYFNLTITLYRSGQFDMGISTDFHQYDFFRWWKVSFVVSESASSSPSINMQYTSSNNSLVFYYESSRVMGVYSNGDFIQSSRYIEFKLVSRNENDEANEAGLDLITYLLTQSQSGDTCVNVKLESGKQSSMVDYSLVNAELFCAKDCFGYVSVCTSDYCLNGGKCFEQNGEPFCNCSVNYIGNNCEHINFCSSSPCSNNAICSPQLNGYTCTCLYPNTTGLHCETTLWCLRNPCRNNGVCMPHADNTGFTCKCTNAKYTGSFCETEIAAKPVVILNGTQAFYELFGQLNQQNCFNWNQQLKNICSKPLNDFLVQQKLVEESTYVVLAISKLCEPYCVKITANNACEDNHKNCNTWKKLGLCNKITNMYPVYCRRTCGTC